jgi:hypothetical protein
VATTGRSGERLPVSPALPCYRSRHDRPQTIGFFPRVRHRGGRRCPIRHVDFERLPMNGPHVARDEGATLMYLTSRFDVAFNIRRKLAGWLTAMNTTLDVRGRNHAQPGWSEPRMHKLDFDRADYSIVVKNRAPTPISWRPEIYALGDQSRSSSHRRIFTP